MMIPAQQEIQGLENKKEFVTQHTDTDQSTNFESSGDKQEQIDILA